MIGIGADHAIKRQHTEQRDLLRRQERHKCIEPARRRQIEQRRGRNEIRVFRPAGRRRRKVAHMAAHIELVVASAHHQAAVIGFDICAPLGQLREGGGQVFFVAVDQRPELPARKKLGQGAHRRAGARADVADPDRILVLECPAACRQNLAIARREIGRLAQRQPFG